MRPWGSSVKAFWPSQADRSRCHLASIASRKKNNHYHPVLIASRNNHYIAWERAASNVPSLECCAFERDSRCASLISLSFSLMPTIHSSFAKSQHVNRAIYGGHDRHTSEGLFKKSWLSKRVAGGMLLSKSSALFSKRSAFALFAYVSDVDLERLRGSYD
jgi:hypothetical protein